MNIQNYQGNRLLIYAILCLVGGGNTRPIAEKVEKTDIETLQLFHLDRTNEFGLMVSEWLSSKDPPECSFIQLPIRHGYYLVGCAAQHLTREPENPGPELWPL